MTTVCVGTGGVEERSGVVLCGTRTGGGTDGNRGGATVFRREDVRGDVCAVYSGPTSARQSGHFVGASTRFKHPK